MVCLLFGELPPLTHSAFTNTLLLSEVVKDNLGVDMPAEIPECVCVECVSVQADLWKCIRLLPLPQPGRHQPDDLLRIFN